MKLQDPVTAIPFVGERHKKLLKNLEIETVEDLLRHYPSRYEDFSQVRKIRDLFGGEKSTIQAEVLEIKNIFTRYGKKLTKTIVRDESGTLLLVWFNQHYLTDVIHEEEVFHFSGELKSFSGQPAMLSPGYERVPASEESPANSSTRPRKTFEVSQDPTSKVGESGEVSLGRAGKSVGRSSADQLIHTGRLVPIYPETAGVSSKWLRSRINTVISNQLSVISKSEILPEPIRREFNLIGLGKAIRKIHFPRNQREIESARKRLAFEEMFMLQLRGLKRRQDWKEKRRSYKLKVNRDQQRIEEFLNSLPFKLTNAQMRCIDEIFADLENAEPMNRLLQGDVGSGKTVVAVTAAYGAALSGFQTAYMAPTEILAQQVFEVFKRYLTPFGITSSLQTGSDNQLSTTCLAGRRVNNQQYPKVIIGTHALLHRPKIFRNLALVIIDEQHRFGVKQRSKLLGINAPPREAGEENPRQGKPSRFKNPNLEGLGIGAVGESPAEESAGLASDKRVPHLLTMTATPIPRSLALTSYGHLDISVVDEIPPGVKPTKTWLVPEEKREAGYEWIKEKLKGTPAKEKSFGELAGLTNQAFIICPLIEESEHETLEDVKAVTTEFKRLKKVFKDLSLGLLHGRMKSQEKGKIIKSFRRGEVQILVSTPVVEVGMDIPQANIIVIEGAHRFGLASLHQLRGRVGRAGQESFCLLFTPKQSENVTRRLKALEKYNSGLKLAEIDLKIRGPGEIYGVKQHGIPKLKIASLSDLGLIKATRAAAKEIITEIDNHPKLKQMIEEGTDRIAPN